jgi:4-hydroxybenzoate polyprenyltransferase
MVGLQAGIGATNDVVDAPRDAGLKPGKPIPAGLVSSSAARAIAGGGFMGGVVLAGVVAGALGGALAAVVLAIGLSYDLRLKGTAWSWLPFAIGIPVLPVYGWLGATGSLPSLFFVLVPAAVLAGAGLAIANSLVDVERDLAAGIQSVSTALGPAAAWLVHCLLIVVVALAAPLSVGPLGGSLAAAAIVGVLALVPVGAAFAGRGGGAARRERAWELEAVALGLLGIVWLLAVRG